MRGRGFGVSWKMFFMQRWLHDQLNLRTDRSLSIRFTAL